MKEMYIINNYEVQAIDERKKRSWHLFGQFKHFSRKDT